jgi:hypothetical protein
MNLAEAVLNTMQNYRLQYNDNPRGEVFISVADAQQLSDSQFYRTCTDFFDRQRPIVHDGDTGTLWGLPYRVDGTLKPGTAYLGHKITEGTEDGSITT